MVARYQTEQHMFATLQEATHLAFLLQRGLNYVQQGHCAEALALFALVREQLSSDWGDLTELLDAFLYDYAEYRRIERTLQEASMRFATVHFELQIQIAAFGKALSTIIKDAFDSDQPSSVFQGEKEPERPLLLSPPARHIQGAPPSLTECNAPLAPLSIKCFGQFAVIRSGKPVILCSSRCGQRILRYLICQPGHNATSDMLQAMLWPEDEPDVASRKLYSAISALRRSLSEDPACEPSCSYIVCKNRVYSLNPSVAIQTDVDEFLHCYHMGQQRSAERVVLYERACQLYTGPFLPEDLYADWSFIQREHLTQAYLVMRNELTDHYLKTKRYEDAIQSAHAVLKENHCDEVAHRHLIQVYIAQGRRSEALRQYQHCERTLREELGVKPMNETMLAIQALLTDDLPSAQQ